MNADTKNLPVPVYVALGCNLGERHRTLQSALAAMAALQGCRDLVCSSFYETEPMGPADQPDYMNAVCRFQADVEPQDLLEALQVIEHEHGRIRDGTRWGARTLDLDILLYGSQRISGDTLTVPHPGIADRSFVLLPLFELDPELLIPGVGAVSKLLESCSQFGIRQLHL